MNYYCKQWGNEIGPLTAGDIRSMARSGAIQPDHFVRAENSDRWVTADSIPNLFQPEATSLSPAVTVLPTQPAALPPAQIPDANKKSALLVVVALLGSATVLLSLALGFLLLKSTPSSNLNASLEASSSIDDKEPSGTLQQARSVSEQSRKKTIPVPSHEHAADPGSFPPENSQKKISQAPTPPTPPRIYRTGEIAIAEGLGYSVVGCRWSNRLSDDPLVDSAPRASYLIVGLVVVNGNAEPYVLPPLHLVDENGTEYSTTPDSIWMKDVIGPIENLNPEVPLSGFIAFDVPRNHRYRLQVRGGLFSTEKVYIALDPK